MRYNPDIITRILKELEKVPNIRYVCNKVGIHHSTFYRWMLYYNAFQKEVLIALFLGRELINGAAETVIIKGVQNEDRLAAIFWLSHNNPRYMQKAKGDQYALVMGIDAKILKKPLDYDAHNFETMFEMAYDMERLHTSKIAKERIRKLFGIFFEEDEDLVELFYISYKRWKDNKEYWKKNDEYFGDREE